MPGRTPIFNQERSYRLLSAFIRKRSIPHALLFSGIRGIGKKEAALYTALGLNCNRQPDAHLYGEGVGYDNTGLSSGLIKPCGACRSCRKIYSESHPDISIIRPSGSVIKIAQIRSLCHTLAMKPFEARFRVVIILDAHLINTPAGNALLKILEEPPKRTVIILVTDQTAHILPTVISRCQPVRFNAIPRKTLASLLIERHAADDMEAKIIASMAEGSYENARRMLEMGWVPLRNWLISGIGSLFLNRPAISLAFAEKLSQSKDDLPQVLTMIQLWFRDLMVYKYDSEKIINKDAKEKIKEASRQHSISDLVRITDVVSKAQKDIQTNANTRLVLETMLCQLREK